MNRPLSFLLAVFVVGSDLRADDAAKGLDQLQGVWAIVSWQEGGREKSADDESKRVTFVIKDDTLTFKHEAQPKALVMKLKLDPSAKPKAVDLISTLDGSTATAKGIYDREGDELKLIWARNGKARPAEFETKRGDDRIFVTLKLAKAKEKEK